MNDDCLKLTTYFGERDRTEHHQLLADDLLDLYERHALATSILLRGISGFGLKHQLRTDQLLTLSEDLPVVSVAVDRRETIETVLPEVLAIEQRGLVTVERARMLTGALTSVELPEALAEATKLTVYIGRQERAGGSVAFAAVTELLHRRRIAGATVLLGVDGTREGRRERAGFFGANRDVPMMIIAVGAGSEIAQVLPELGDLLRRPIVTLERVRICKRDGQLIATPDELPSRDERGMEVWQKLMIYSAENARHEGKPLHRALVEALRRSDVAGATSVRGIWGFHGDHAPHGDKLLQLYRHTPVVTIVVDTPERIAQAFPIIDELTAQTGLITSEMVPAARATSGDEVRGSTRLARYDF